MNIRAILQRLTGSKRSYEENECPGEAGILAFAEGKLARSDRAKLETHLAKCDDCRELLAFTGEEVPDAINAEMISDKEVRQQTARVLAYIELDESKRSRVSHETATRREPVKAGFYVSYPKLAFVALVVCAVAAGSVFWLASDQRSDVAAMAALRLAMKDDRRNQALISGDIDYSPYSPKRGGEESDDLNYERALNKLRFAEKETASAESRHSLARVLLAMGGRDNARKALTILDQLEAAGVQSAGLFNDLGVAQLQLGRYDAAVDYFTRALDKSPDASRFLFNRALAEQKAGRADEARKDWNHLLNVAPDERLKAEARSQLGLLR